MDWGLIGVTLAPIFFITTTFLALKLVRRRKPAWAYHTSHIIGLHGEAPPELKLTFGTRQVTDVYKTLIMFFNKGNEVIRGNLSDASDINENIVMHFGGGEILRQPTLCRVSKEGIKFSTKQVIKNGDNAIELYFRYLGHHDGVIIEVLHTKCDAITCSGDVMNAEITHLKDLITSRPKDFYKDLAVVSGLIVFFGWVIFQLTSSVIQAGVWHWSDVLIIVLLVAFFILVLIVALLRFIHYWLLPRWSIFKE